MSRKVDLIKMVFQKHTARDNTALVDGAEKYMEKLVGKKFERETNRCDEKILREFIYKVYEETLKTVPDFERH